MNTDPEYEVLREVWIITEMRDGCVYKTEYSHDAWVPMGVHGVKGECVYATPKTWTPPRRREVK